MRKIKWTLSIIILLFSAGFVIGQPAKVKNHNWHGYASFYLSASFTKSFWIDDLLPFGFKLNKQSRLKIDSAQQHTFISHAIPVTDTTFFSSAVYSFNDSVVQKVRLYPVRSNNILKIRDTLEKVLDAYFYQKDFTNANETVYSDDDLLVSINIKDNFLEISSLNHQRLLEEIAVGINLRNYKIDNRMDYHLAPGEAVHLGFYNQITKENNVQLAFNIQYNSSKPINYNEVIFEISGEQRVLFRVKPAKNGDGEKVSRCFIDIADAKRILKSEKVKIILSGPNTKSYLLPEYQKHSLKTAIQFYKENVTHPLIHYPGW